MRPDVIALRNFYERPLGRAAALCIADQIDQLWPDLEGQHIAGIGYAPPLLDQLSARHDAAGKKPPASMVALMPAAQGVVHWPDTQRNATALIEEDALPLPDGSFDRLVLIHALEVADHLPGLLRELWRVLSPGGRVIIIVPRRRGTWAGFERTPFGSGQPYSSQQLERTLASYLLPVTRIRRSLFAPPFGPFSQGRGMRFLERSGAIFLGSLAGLLIVEAEKQIYRAVPNAPVHRPVFAPVIRKPALGSLSQSHGGDS
ncbi:MULTISPECIES: class I SAM-dependent methyltransferase [unclassified Iodidimonas]|jgi:SAM-dependent methyltransferase|uniref:class I SAM-dependent methyltransferase n=1 Tax=unclassified Iodidimonas TaxID=2626145 RepID=UPI002482FB17|nr:MULTISPECIES: class I SAM-dependent methyltransferase [unclassified Iodidimonas]